MAWAAMEISVAWGKGEKNELDNILPSCMDIAYS